METKFQYDIILLFKLLDRHLLTTLLNTNHCKTALMSIVLSWTIVVAVMKRGPDEILMENIVKLLIPMKSITNFVIVAMAITDIEVLVKGPAIEIKFTIKVKKDSNAQKFLKDMQLFLQLKMFRYQVAYHL